MRERVAYRRISVAEAQDLVNEGNALLLDVREPAAFNRGHINGARNVSMSTLEAIFQGTSKSRPILIYCYHGNASRHYAQIFSDFGYTSVYSVDGGYQAWSDRLSPPVARARDEALQQWLTTQGFSPATLDSVIANGTTPLMQASHTGRSDIVSLLIAAGAQLDARNADGNNALWLACVGAHLDVIDLLVEAGIDIDNQNDNGATPLMYAASSSKAGVVERLLAKGADIAPETLDGFTALDMAASVECLTLLRTASRAAKIAGAAAAHA